MLHSVKCVRDNIHMLPLTPRSEAEVGVIGRSMALRLGFEPPTFWLTSRSEMIALPVLAAKRNPLLHRQKREFRRIRRRFPEPQDFGEPPSFMAVTDLHARPYR
jgi:hypothetical protein